MAERLAVDVEETEVVAEVLAVTLYVGVILELTLVATTPVDDAECVVLALAV